MTSPTENNLEDKFSNKETLKKIAAKKKKLREQEKALRLEMDANKEERKAARKKVTRTKAEVFEKRQNITAAIRAVNQVMLTKSIKNNIDDFKTAIDNFFECSSEFINDANDHIEAIEELEKYE